MPLRRRRTAQNRPRRALSPWARVVLGLLLAGFIAYLTWPARASVLCEQLPELTALAVCAATLFVFSVRTLALTTARNHRALAGGACILAGLAFFLSVHYVALYRAPCIAVQHQLHSR